MHKPDYYLAKSSQNISYPRQSTPNLHHLPITPSKNTRIDLKKFNEYLQDRISSRVYQNYIRNSKREDNESNTYLPLNAHSNQQRQVRPPSANNKQIQIQPNESKVSWRRHESIEKLLQKENKGNSNCKIKNDDEHYSQPSIGLMERKYQDLQEKYKSLLQETSSSCKQFEDNQRELQRLQAKHSQDQTILKQLRYELMSIQQKKTMKKGCNAETSTNNLHSQQIIDSDISINNSQLAQPIWKDTPKADLRSSNIYSKANKTSQSWMNKTVLPKSPKQQTHNRLSRQLLGSEPESKRESWRYYSAEKGNTRRNSKMKKISDHSQCSNIESKTSIKLRDSIANSRLKGKQPQRYEPQKSITPTTLHKKVLNANHYSKYRFQPTVRL